MDIYKNICRHFMMSKKTSVDRGLCLTSYFKTMFEVKKDIRRHGFKFKNIIVDIG